MATILTNLTDVFTHYTTSLKNYLNKNYIRLDANQTITSAQATKIRASIGAGTSNFDGNYSSLSSKPTLPTAASQLTTTTDQQFATDAQIAQIATNTTNAAAKVADLKTTMANFTQLVGEVSFDVPAIKYADGTLQTWEAAKTAGKVTMSGSTLQSATLDGSVVIPSEVTGISADAFTTSTGLKAIVINKAENSISGAPWGAPNAAVFWVG